MTTDRLFAKFHEHYILVMMLVTRMFALVGGGLVIYYVNLTFTLPPAMERDFSLSAMVVVIGTVIMSVLIAVWETRALRRAIRELRQGRTVEPALALRAGHEALTFPSRHTQHEALFDPCVTVLPVCIFLHLRHDAPWALLLQVAIAGFLGISSVLLTTFFILESWMPAVVRYLDERGIVLHFDAVPISRLHFRLNVCFGLTIVVTALMIGALANQRAMEIVRNPNRQAEAVSSLRYHTSCIMVVAMCIGLFLSRMLASSIGSRAGLLVDAMKRVQDGDLSQRVKPAGNDEIDLLARQFNAMVEQLSQNDNTIRDLYVNLEHKVQQRTRQLSKSRKSLKRSLGKLREYDRVKTEFFSNVSHELRTPLTMILAPIGRMLQKRGADLPADAVQTLRTVQLNGRRLLDLINRMLDFSKLEAGQMRLTLEPLDLNALIRSLAAAATPLAVERGIRLELDFDESLPVFEADREKVDTVISNLVSNALKFTPAGGRIQVQTSSDSLHACVSVRDSGMGIDPSHHRRIFERFVQVDGSCSRQFSGTGLGLALAKELVELHGGTIRVESTLEQGACFWCEFPLRLAAANTPVREHENPAQAVRFADLESADEPEFQTSMPADETAPTVLVVDDTPEIRGLVGEILLDAGYRVLFGVNGAQGLEIANAESPDLIISDVMMPQVDGYEFCRRIKQNPRTAHIPFVLLTAKAALAMKIDGLESGADDYLTKPFDEDELRARTRSLVRLRRLHSDLENRNTELATAYEDLRSMQNQLVQSEKMSSLGLLVAGLAHEINNSINAVYNGIQPLALAAERLARMIDGLMPTLEAAGEAGFRSEVERHFRRIFSLATVIENGASRTARIIHDLKTFSHPGNEEHREFDLHETLDMCLNLLINQIKHRVIIRRDYGTITRVVGPTGQLNQVFMNLLNNAQQAIPGEGEIVLTTRQEGSCLSVSIRDNGTGIPPEAKEKIFDPFFTTKEPGMGTGLGLSLSYGIISKLGGTIECISSPGEGAEFVVRFSLSAGGSEPGGRSHHRRVAGHYGLEPWGYDRMRDILCVDDETDNLIVFEATFEQEFRIWPANSGREALELLETHSFPVVVADQRMPQMTGNQLFEIMRRKHPHTKRIMLTGYADNEAILSSINQGQVYNFIKKPWERSVVFPLLLRAIEAYDLAVSNLALTDRLVTVDRCAALGQCAARIAHEMGNQLCMLPLLELIEDKYAHLDDLVQTAEFARGTYDRLVELINEVKAFVRQQHSGAVLQPLLLTETLHELMDFLRYDATLPVRAVQLELRAEPTVRANKTKLQQVLVNLLKNAAHAIADRPQGQIVISLDCEADQAVLRVRDNGIGMTPQVLERIWDPFFTTKGASGTGLGLDISRSIIQSHGGRIECQSAPGCGATFTISLPVASATDRPEPLAGIPVFPAITNIDHLSGECPRT